MGRPRFPVGKRGRFVSKSGVRFKLFSEKSFILKTGTCFDDGHGVFCAAYIGGDSFDVWGWFEMRFRESGYEDDSKRCGRRGLYLKSERSFRFGPFSKLFGTALRFDNWSKSRYLCRSNREFALSVPLRARRRAIFRIISKP